jgi:hypothetical protein
MSNKISFIIWAIIGCYNLSIEGKISKSQYLWTWLLLMALLMERIN